MKEPLGLAITHGNLTITFHERCTWVHWSHIDDNYVTVSIGSRVIKELDDAALQMTKSDLDYEVCLEANRVWIQSFDRTKNTSEARNLADLLLRLELENLVKYQRTMQRLYDYAGHYNIPKDLQDDYAEIMKNVPDLRS